MKFKLTLIALISYFTIKRQQIQKPKQPLLF
jgi:hypothetical protein